MAMQKYTRAESYEVVERELAEKTKEQQPKKAATLKGLREHLKRP